MTATPQSDPLTFYRGCLSSEPGVLMSNFDGYRWTRGLNQARCNRGHRAPSPKCSCGLYGYLEVSEAVDHWFGDLLDAGIEEDELAVVPIVLECSGFGLMEVGSVGCRVEYAQIEALLDVGQGIDLSPWADAYDVIVVRSNLDISPVAEGTVRSVRMAETTIELQLDDAARSTRTFTAPRYSRVGFDLRMGVRPQMRLRIVKDHNGQVLDFRTMGEV